MNGFLYALVVVIWGTTWIAIGLQQGEVAVAVSVFWRFAIASGVMLVGLSLLRRLRSLSVKDHLFCVMQGACVFGFNFFCFYHASAWINTGLESVIFSMAVLFNTLNSLLFFGIRPPARIIPAALAGIAGIIALFWQELANSTLTPSLLLGMGLCLAGTYGFSLGNMIAIRHQRRGLDVLSTNSFAMLYGALIMGTLALLQGESFRPTLTVTYLGALFYLAIFGSVIAFAAYFSLVTRLGPGKAAYSTLLFPLVALTLSTFYEGYVWHLNAVLGLGLILTGNVVMFTGGKGPVAWLKKNRRVPGPEAG